MRGSIAEKIVSVWYEVAKGRWVVMVQTGREEPRIFIGTFRRREETELAAAFAKAEWLKQRMCAQMGEDDAKRLVEQLDLARVMTEEGSRGISRAA